MSEKYTMGPWNANFTRFSGWVVGFHITDLEHGSLRPICEAYDKTGAMNPNEIAANARLISAAPELLSAVRLAISPFDGTPDSECPYWVKPARAAILKATGEKS